MSKITVVTKVDDFDGPFHIEYAGTLIDDNHAIYIDPDYNVAVMERVDFDVTEYVTSYGEPTIFDLTVEDLGFIDNIHNMSAIELLTKFIRKGDTQHATHR
ncbi:hypothetical protein [Paenibacillus silvae]|uniref:hypothetical protein n=1 Tax=Paenibacillus silvae TaxID=1325358 RepID=UPI0020058A2E|nr:hypothetical protein [Paenibacillus silvae]MCK6076278.1 hypothetical protein [Paenibacillus silvae]MCK6150563.1 hypothetical protein [Paenibacillus silvae]MCK6268823.1 hypothetical protein [Paenibacillus silvae]MCK6270416.1 hypothetical protein [Paenibacillus silvae]